MSFGQLLSMKSEKNEDPAHASILSNPNQSFNQMTKECFNVSRETEAVASSSPAHFQLQQPNLLFKQKDIEIAINNASSTSKTFSCHIGGFPQDVVVTNGQNVMTRAVYRELRSKKFVFFNSNRDTVVVNGQAFMGSFLTYVKFNGIKAHVLFYVINDEGMRNPELNKQSAKQMKIDLPLL